MSVLSTGIRDLEERAHRAEDGLMTWPEMEQLAYLYTVWHNDRPDIQAARLKELNRRG